MESLRWLRPRNENCVEADPRFDNRYLFDLVGFFFALPLRFCLVSVFLNVNFSDFFVVVSFLGAVTRGEELREVG